MNGYTTRLAIGWVAVLAVVAALEVRGQEVRWAPCNSEKTSTAGQPTSADVRVSAHLGNDTTGDGSGTAIASHDGGTVVLTNEHVIHGAAWVSVCAGGQCNVAKVIGIDQTNDLALLWIPLAIKHVAVGTMTPVNVQAQFRAFDGGVHFRSWVGRILRRDSYSYVADTYSVGGNSGGGVYVDGRLVGVLWGNRDGQLAFTGAGPIRALLGRFGIGVAANAPQQVMPAFPSPSATAPVPSPPSPAGVSGQGASCGCADRFAALEKQQAAANQAIEQLTAIVEQTARTPGPAGPRGPAGPMGPAGPVGSPGQDVTIDEAALVTQVTQAVLAQIQLPESPDSQKYYVLVASDEASYWPRLGGELAAAQEAYSHIRLAPPPNYSVGPLPQLVEYQAGKPLRSIAGSHEVSSALSHLARGETP